jgi:DNA-binding transcriptional LysR family regulator
MSLRALRILCAIAHQGSFARAGGSMGLTQSAVSLQVKAMESEFGAQLFDRSRRYPRLTEAGKIVLAKAEEVLALYDGISEALSDEHSLAGRLRIGAIQTALSGPIPDALAALNRAHPTVRVHVGVGMSVELATRVAAGDLDAAITTEPVRPYPNELVWTYLYEDRFWVIAPPGNEHRDVRDILTDWPFIRFDRRAWAGRMIDWQLRQMLLEVREEMVLDSQEVIIKMVERGLGASVIALADEAVWDLHLTCIPFDEPQLVRRVVLVERRNRPTGRLCSVLGQAIIDTKAKQHSHSIRQQQLQD